MARVVWKKTLEYTADPQRFVLPGFERVVHVAIQHGTITLWYLAHPTSTYQDSRTFQIFGTGDDTVPDDAVYLGSVLQSVFVWHVFEVQVPGEDT